MTLIICGIIACLEFYAGKEFRVFEIFCLYSLTSPTCFHQFSFGLFRHSFWIKLMICSPPLIHHIWFLILCVHCNKFPIQGWQSIHATDSLAYRFTAHLVSCVICILLIICSEAIFHAVANYRLCLWYFHTLHVILFSEERGIFLGENICVIFLRPDTLHLLQVHLT